MDDFLKLENIGEGTYGEVIACKNKKTGDVVAIKKIRMQADEGVPATVIREICILKDLQHPNIVTLLDVLMEDSRLYLIFEFLPMDLQKYMNRIESGVVTNPVLVKCFLFQINNAIMYCHKRQILHRDLKPQNILVEHSGVIKVADFGLGRSYREPVKAYTPKVATLWYRAIELLLGCKTYSYPIDVWSIGCVFAEMACNKPLFEGASEIDQIFLIFSKLRTPNELIWPGVSELPDYNPNFPNWNEYNLNVANLDANGLDLLQRMLIYNPAERIVPRDIYHHPYFKDVKVPQAIADKLLAHV